MRTGSGTYRATAFLLGGLLWGGLSQAQAQSTPVAPPPAVWWLWLEGQRADGPLLEPLPPDSLDRVAHRVLTMLQAQGYYGARLDSARIDPTRIPPAVHLFATRGARAEVGAFVLTGMQVFDPDETARQLETRPGRVFDAFRLEADLDALLLRYEAAGYPFAQARIDSLVLAPGGQLLDVYLHLAEGPAPVLGRIELRGAVRTKPGYVAHLLGLTAGRTLAGWQPDGLRQRLEATGLFREVGLPELMMEDDSSVVVRIPLTEAAPGVFDVVLGYLPPAGPGTRGSVIGNGHLLLRNLFGSGKELGLRINRLPGQVSSADLRVAFPFVFGWPVGVEGRFQGLQQDSTYGRTQLQGRLGYTFEGRLEVFATGSREVTSAGQAGVQLQQGRQRIPQARASFFGLGIRYERTDHPLNPRRGLSLETNLERGRKHSTALEQTPTGDTTTTRTLLRQERLQGQVRFYLPTLPRQLVALGGEVALLGSDAYEASELFRFGGATSLRGYDEDRFRGRFAGRMLAEYRYQLDRLAYAFLFFDLGYVETPATVDLTAQRGFWPGYGLGLQFSTPIGLVNVSYAANPDDGPANARVHVGLSFGL